MWVNCVVWKNAFFHVWEMKKSLMRYLFSCVFFSDNTWLFGIIWASLWEKLFSGVGGGGGGGGVGVSTKSVSNQSPQLERLAWKLKFHLQQVYIWYFPKSKKKKALIRLRGCAGWSAPVLFTNLGRQGFSRRGPYYSYIYDPCNSEWTASHVFFFVFFFNSHRKFILFCWIVLHFICFTKRCLAN